MREREREREQKQMHLLFKVGTMQVEEVNDGCSFMRRNRPTKLLQFQVGEEGLTFCFHSEYLLRGSLPREKLPEGIGRKIYEDSFVNKETVRAMQIVRLHALLVTVRGLFRS